MPAKSFTINTRFTATDATSRTMGKMQSRMSAMTARMSRGMNKATRVANKMAGGLTKGLKVGAGIAAMAIGGLFLALGKTADRMDELAEKTAAINFPIEEYQKWAHVAKVAGVETEAFDSNMTRFSKGFAEAQSGMGGMYSKMKKINPGLAKQMKVAKDSAEGFDILVKAMREAPNESQRMVLATAAFGKTGAMMTNISRMSAEEVERLKKEMEGMGIITSEQAKQASDYNDAMDRMKTTMAGLMVSVLMPLMPIIKDIVNALKDWIIANKDLIASKFKEWIQWVIDNKDAIATWAKRIAALIAVFYSLVAVMNVINAVMTILNVIMSLNPVVLIILAFLAAIAAIWYFRDEIDSVMFYIFDWCAEVGAAFGQLWDSVVEYFYFVMTPLTWFFENSFALWGEILSLFSDLWNGNWEAIGARFVGLWEWIKGYYIGLWNGLLAFFQGIWAVMTWTVEAFTELFNGDFDALGTRFKSLWEGMKQAAIDALLWIARKFKPVSDLIMKTLGVFGAIGGQTDLSVDVAGSDPGGNGGAMAGSGAMLPPEVMSSAGGNYNETFDTTTSTQTTKVVIEDKTGKARTKGKRQPNVRLVHSGVTR